MLDVFISRIAESMYLLSKSMRVSAEDQSKMTVGDSLYRLANSAEVIADDLHFLTERVKKDMQEEDERNG